MYNKPINGWTKETILEKIKARPFEEVCMIENKDGDIVCGYKNAEGNRCAVGLFIPNKHKGLKFQGLYIELVREYPELLSYMPLDRDGMEELQRCHDLSDHLKAKSNMIEWVKENVK